MLINCLPQTLKDFFHLSEAEFAERLSDMTNDELMRDDIHNCRASHSGAYGAVIGAVEAPVTLGVSLVGTGIGLRRRNVAKRRLGMIHGELQRRGLPLHAETKRDCLIPLGVAAIGATVSGRLVDGLMGAVPVASLADAGITFTSSATGQVAQEATGKMVLAVDSEHLMGEGMSEKGRKQVWKEKIGMARSTSARSSSLVVPVAEEKAALSAPSSPLLKGEERPPLPPRPRSAAAQIE